MRKNVKLVIIVVFLPVVCCAQFSRFIKAGTIQFEKSINMFAVLKEGYDPNIDPLSAKRYEQYKSTQPQFVKQLSTLTFVNDKTLFLPDQTSAETEWGEKYPMTKQFNTIYANLSEGISITQKDIYGDLFLVKDSVRNIKWKISNEVREIAGFTCRRANAVIMDSIYVVAFYTTAIPVSSGPESFTGLPGMILGLALPHEHITWFANKVIDSAVTEISVAPPRKGILSDNTQLEELLRAMVKSKPVNGLSISTVFRL